MASLFIIFPLLLSKLNLHFNHYAQVDARAGGVMYMAKYLQNLVYDGRFFPGAEKIDGKSAFAPQYSGAVLS
ncbi:MAG: hypothetical protein NXH95_03490 [Pseudomonadaceae bacterium]|nr:hypothetical protein [Pseudomonadaceae bacterium]